MPEWYFCNQCWLELEAFGCCDAEIADDGWEPSVWLGALSFCVLISFDEWIESATWRSTSERSICLSTHVPTFDEWLSILTLSNPSTTLLNTLENSSFSRQSISLRPPTLFCSNTPAYTSFEVLNEWLLAMAATSCKWSCKALDPLLQVAATSSIISVEKCSLTCRMSWTPGHWCWKRHAFVRIPNLVLLRGFPLHAPIMDLWTIAASWDCICCTKRTSKGLP